MSNPPFLRPMFAGFAVTATAILVMPMGARAQTALPTTQCETQPVKPHGARLGHLLSAARQAGIGQLIGGAGRGASLVGALANTAIEAAGQSQADAERHATTAACAASNE